ncbi:hypothetical protein [uncultured Bacteroides sp.]|uniref:hypothetical protein n=1 Tax=uncultured Bacteroides sp. TaxID=162156 RepID=UPI002AA93E9E|nr:hypothetical protein [uncultured Bacteroides sp.]
MSSLVLENGNPIKLGDELTISFDIYNRKDCVFGNVFRFVTDKNENIDLLYTVGENDKRFPAFVIKESIHPIPKEIAREQWIPVRVTFSSKSDQIILSYGATKLPISYPISKSKSVRMCFGLCPFENFTLSDVASINIKNIKIIKNKKTIRYWKLEKHNKQSCYDLIQHVPAIATNAYWLIDDHITWQKIYSKKHSACPSIAFNSSSGIFYMASDSKRLFIFDTNKQRTDSLNVTSGNYVVNSPNQLIYIPDKKKLISYNIDENLFSFFSFNDRSWSSNNKSVKEHSYWNNTAIYCPTDSSIVSFGGYGFYRYNNELIKQYPYGNREAEKIQLTEISPRYSVGSAIVNNTLYLFGGRGCKSGRQELSPKNYYDFYSINLLTRQVNKLWESTNIQGGDFVSGENMIYDPRKKCFYMFATQSGGVLMKIKPDSIGLEPMSLPMNINFESQYLYTNLYYSPKQKKLYALINKTRVDNTSDISIYSINYPPISVNDLLQQNQTEESENSFIWYIIFAAIALLTVISYLYYKNKTIKKDVRLSKPTEQEVNISLAYDIENKIKEECLSSYYDFSKQCICLLGGFQVKDREGNDITGLFTPTLKSLLILLIMYTEENPKGILGNKMIQLLWYDKSEDSAKNNRNVYLSKLRTILEKIGDIEIINQNSFWSIKFGKDLICDYKEAMQYYTTIKENHTYDEEAFNKLLELLLRGTLLPNTEIDWIDKFKSDFSNMTIDTLCSLLRKENTSNDFKLKIADTIFQHDYINEEALCIKCSILCESGKKGLAKNLYDNFCKEYLNSLGTEYRHSLSDVINMKL